MALQSRGEQVQAQAKAAVKWYEMRRRLIQNWAHIMVPLALLVGLLMVRISGWGWVELAQFRTFDSFQKLKPRPYEDAAVRIIDIDDETLARLGQWPWPRTLVARLVRRLNELGVAVVAFDAVFAEPDRTSPSRVVASWPKTPDLESVRARAGSMPDHDKIFAAEIARAGNVVLGFAMSHNKPPAPPLVKVSIGGAEDALPWVDRYDGAVPNLPVLEKAAKGIGVFSFTPEYDSIIRRAPLLQRYEDQLYPSLSAEALRVAQRQSAIKVKANTGQLAQNADAAKALRTNREDDGGNLVHRLSGESFGGTKSGILKVKVGLSIVPTDSEGCVWVYYTEPAPERVIPLWQVFEKDFDASKVGGAIAFIGTSAAGLKDLRATPLNPSAAGVEVHANVVEQMALGKFLQRPDWGTGAELFYAVILGLALLFLLPRLGAVWSGWVGAAGIFGALAFSWYMFTRKGFLLDPVFPFLTTVVIYMSSSLISYLKSETERRQVRNAFSRYMHPKLVEELAKHPEKLKLGGETRDMTVLFCDIRGFTTISEQFDSAGLTTMINKFLTPMTGIIMDRMGYIDKYIGDCIMAFWNAPLDDAEHARNACRAALAMHARLAELEPIWKAEAEAAGRKYVPIRIGVGLNTGPCCVGNMGSDQRFNYSVLGDDVNLASRLEGQSKPYGVSTVIGPRTRELAAEFAALELDLIRVKGKTKPVRICALMGGPEMAADPAFKAHEENHNKMLAAYRGRKWDEALSSLAQCRESQPLLEKLHDMYEERIGAFQLHPPASTWDGTFTATTK